MKAVALLSGGIDSPVAIKRMQGRGLDIVAVHFSYYPLTDKSSTDKCVALCKKLSVKKLYVVPFASPQTEVASVCYHGLFYVITKRLMMRIAAKIAVVENADYLVTGENLGQVSSQTLSNLMNISDCIEIPILRPLLTNDKVEIIRMAEEIDTFDISKGPEICCLLGPKHPDTYSFIGKVEGEEKKLDFENVLELPFRSRELILVDN